MGYSIGNFMERFLFCDLKLLKNIHRGRLRTFSCVALHGTSEVGSEAKQVQQVEYALQVEFQYYQTIVFLYYLPFHICLYSWSSSFR